MHPLDILAYQRQFKPTIKQWPKLTTALLAAHVQTGQKIGAVSQKKLGRKPLKMVRRHTKPAGHAETGISHHNRQPLKNASYVLLSIIKRKASNETAIRRVLA